MRPANMELSRGGVRGIAMIGAVDALQRAGYAFRRMAGVSAGAMVAALIAAGYRDGELRRVVWELDLSRLRDARSRLPLIGPVINLLPVRRFADLRAHDGGYLLRVLAADVTRECMIVLPEDARAYGIDPDELEVAFALRMSASLPLFFRPVRLAGRDRASVIVDGGLLAGVPLGVFADAADPWPTLGIDAGPRRDAALRARPIRGPAALLAASYYTALRANAEYQRSTAEAGRTIHIDCGAVTAVRFGLSDLEKQMLYDAGERAADAFLRRAQSDTTRKVSDTTRGSLSLSATTQT